jgi:hypothetical protein
MDCTISHFKEHKKAHLYQNLCSRTAILRANPSSAASTTSTPASPETQRFRTAARPQSAPTSKNHEFPRFGFSTIRP